jgi:hypothetical protein
MHTRRALELASFFCVVHKRCHPPRARDPLRQVPSTSYGTPGLAQHEAQEAARQIGAQEVIGGRKSQEACLALACDARKGES